MAKPPAASLFSSRAMSSGAQPRLATGGGPRYCGRGSPREAAGGVSFQLGGDVERVSAEIGYWLGQPFWGRGIATEALVALTEYAVATHGLTRVFAAPFGWNTAPCRVAGDI